MSDMTVKEQRLQHTDEKQFGGKHKEEVAKQGHDVPPSEGDKISYGKKFAQTEELYQAHQMERELEELAKSDGMLAEEREDEAELEEQAEGPEASEGRMFVEHRERDTGRAAKKRTAKKGPSIEDVTRGAPIGATPKMSEPPPRSGLREVLEDAQRYVGMMRGGARDIFTAGMRLARLPIEVAMLAAARIRPQRA